MNRLVIAGIRTEVCVDTACRRAHSLGYKVVLPRMHTARLTGLPELDRCIASALLLNR